MRVLHLSDTHLTREAGTNSFGVDPRQALRGLLGDLANLPAVDVVVVSGDVADDGSPAAYRTARDLVGTFAAERNASTIYATGNHDDRHAFASALGSGHLDACGGDRASARLISAEAERAAVSTVDGFRFVTLDSLVPGRAYGMLGRNQLDWLRDVLSAPAPRGSVLVLHHPPITLDVEVQRALALQNASALAETIRQTDVQLVLCGHFHLQLLGRLGTAAVSVTPGVVSRIDLTAAPRTQRAVRGASATLVELGTPPSPVFHTLHGRDPRMGETVYELDEPGLAAVIGQLGAPPTVRPGPVGRTGSC